MLSGQPKKIVFIGHDASLSGAPVLLYNLLFLLQQKKTAQVVVLAIQREGAFLPHYQEHFPVILLKPNGYGKEKNLFRRAVNVLRNRMQLCRLLLKVTSCDLIFSNTIVNGKLLKTLSFLKKPVITYVHELEQVIEYYRQTGDTAEVLRYTNQFAYPSQKVQQTLHDIYHVPEDNLHRLSYYFPVDGHLINNTQQKEAFTGAFKKKHALNNYSLLVGGMGRISKRKGVDIFIDICEKVTRVNKDIKFCWIGGFESAAIEVEVKQILAEKNIGENIVFTGELEHNYYNLATFDLYLLSSREDPYPLVVLEAGLMKVPSLCFEPSGGITEFVDTDAGWIIPGFSTEEAAKRILMLYTNKDLLAEKGENAYRKSLQLHCNETLIMSQFTTLINNIH